MDENQEKQEKQKKQKADWNIKPYLAVGLTSFLVIILSITVFFLIYRYHGLARNWDYLVGILQPIIIGLVLAYLINPIVMFLERHLLPLLKRHMKREEKAKKAARGLSVGGALLFLFVILAVLLNMVIPELYYSIERMVTQLPRQVESFMDWIENYISSDSEISSYLEQGLKRGLEYLETWAETEFFPQTKNVLSSLTTGVISVVKILFNLVIGIIISVYVLMGKETFVGQAKKIIYAILPAQKGNVVVDTVRKSNQIFGGFISGKILDSAIIGILCFIVLYLLKMPYAVLVSVIVGVTNVVPFFGPYIGAIPSTILIMLTSPIQGLYFIIFILILQQVDGNIIGPRILGESTGLSSFWVVFAILVGGGLFGFMGMVLGVPVFATIYYLIRKMIAYILRKKGLPEATRAYTEAEKVDPSTRRLSYKQNEQEQEEKENTGKEKR